MKSSDSANFGKEHSGRIKGPLTQKRKINRLGLLLSLAILCGGSVVWLWPKQNHVSVALEPESAAALPVKLQKLDVSAIEISSEFVGVLEAQQRVRLRPDSEGRIVEVLVASGTSVSPGTPLIRLRPDKNRAQLNSANAKISSLRAALKQAESELSAAEAEQAREAAELRLQEEEFQRTRFLVDKGAQSVQNLDRVNRDRQAALASVEVTQRRIKAAEAAIDAAKADLRQAEAEADLEQEHLQDTEIAAPIAGIIGDIPVKVGDYVDNADTLTTITQNQALELRLTIPVEYILQLRIGLPVELRTAQEGDPLVVGEISFVSPTVDATSQAVLAKARFPNPQGILRDQQFVRARIIWEQVPGILAPTSAITRLGNQTFVFVAQATAANESEEPQSIAALRAVKLGSLQGNYYQVVDGLEPGETLITSGLLNLSDGVPIMPELADSTTETSD